MLTRGVWRAAALLSVVMLAGCSTQEPAPAPPTTRTRIWPTADAGLRPVTVTYRDGLAYVFEETSAQALCDALTPGEWQQLLGEDVIRVVGTAGDEACLADANNGLLTVRARMSSDFPGDMTRARTEDIDGHQAWFIAGGAAAEVAPRGAPSPARPLLTLTATLHYPEDRWDEVNDKLKQLLTMLLTRLAHDAGRRLVQPDPSCAGRPPVRPAATGPGAGPVHGDGQHRRPERHTHEPRRPLLRGRRRSHGAGVGGSGLPRP